VRMIQRAHQLRKGKERHRHLLLEAATRRAMCPAAQARRSTSRAKRVLPIPGSPSQQHKASWTARDCAEDREHVFELGLLRDQRLVRALHVHVPRA
jgi:hypothetical protein